MISPHVVTVLRKRSIKRKPLAGLIGPSDAAFESRWTSRAEIAAFAILALLTIWPIVAAAIAVHMLP